MNLINLPWQKMVATLASALPFFSLINYFSSIQAQTFSPVASTISQVDGELHFTPPDRGSPTRQGSTGRRGNCPIFQPPLIALVPLTQQALNEPSNPTRDWKLGLGITNEPYPTLWFYIPKLPPNITLAELRMKEGDRDIFDPALSIQLPSKLYETGGIISVRLPQQEQLQLNKQYQWSFSIICDSTSPAKNPTVSGWVERVTDSEFKSQIEQAATDDKKRIRIYAANGIWHEAITLLAKQRCANPSNPQLASDWTNLLQSIGQGDIAQAPIIQCPLP